MLIPMAYGGGNQAGAHLDFESETFLVQQVAFPIQNATRGKDQNGLGIGDADAPMYTLDNGSQHGVALAPIAFSSKDYGGDACYDLSPTLRAGNHAGSHANAGSPPAIAFDARQNCVSSTDVFGALGSSSPQAQAVCIHADAIGRTGDALTPSADAEGRIRLRNPGMGIIDDGTTYNLMASGQAHAVCITGDITHTLKAEGFDASEDGTGSGQPIVAAFAENSRAEIRLEGGDGSRTGALSTGCGKPGQGTPMVLAGMAVRRLTPRECERLQAFPDFYTLIPMGIVKTSRAETMLAKGDPVECIDGVWWKMAADGPRYKALGNSMCTNNISWIGRRIELVLMQQLVAAA